jgi:hypothetical protein
VLLVVLAALASGASTLAASPSPATLLAKFQPVTYLYDKTDWAPAPVESLITSSALARAQPDGTWKTDGVLLESTAQLPDPSTCASTAVCALDLVACPVTRLGQEGDDCYLRIPKTAPLWRYASVVYGSVRRNTGYRAAAIPTILQYWYFYPVNWWRSTPARPVAEQIHEGDWESVTVGLGASGSPVFVAYSQHVLGVWTGWSDVARRGTHPVVYVARGSHANYFTPGRHRIPPASAGPAVASLGVAVEPLLRDYTCNRRELEYGPAGVAAKATAVIGFTEKTDWATFRGAWGKGDFLFLPRGPNLIPVGGSPSGPVGRGYWRDPVGTIMRSWPRQKPEPIDAAFCPSARRG